jgi:WD40 repeat protein
VTWTRILVVLGVLSLSAPAAAQYFGRNKVQYDRFDFSILQTPHFDVYYYASEREAAGIAARLAERWYARLSSELDHRFQRRQPIILYASHAQFAQTSIVSESIGDGIGGFTDGLAGRVVLPFAAGLGETDHVLGHEIVHAFQRDILRQRGRSLAMLPLWFSEGMAEYLSVRELDANTRMWLRDSADADKLPTIAQLDDPRWFPYRYGQALWEFIADTYGEDAVAKALKSLAKGGAIGRLKDVTGKDGAALTKAWHAFVRTTATLDCAEDGEPCHRVEPKRIIGPEQNGGRMNVAPALSPDGRRVVFLSERDGYSVDVFLADASHGTVTRKLLSSATDAHFDSLQFVDSAGAWDRSGHAFALATLRDGQAVLTLFDMPDGVVRKELPIPRVDQIFSPTWSPDGQQIAFSALKGGLTDLFLVDVKNGAVRQLTTDPYSDLQPSWSPDGHQIVFATDRFSSSLDTLSFGRYQLATLDVESGAVRLVGGLPDAKNIDPHWSGDGRTIVFVSDAGGVSNVHALDVTTGRIARITDVGTGVSGITALSPAVSISADGHQAAFSMYWRGTYDIRRVVIPAAGDQRATDEEAPLESRVSVPEAASLAPGAEPPSEPAFSSHAYAPRLSIAQLGSPYLSAGGGAFGTFVRAGVSIGFGDMLGAQSLETAVQVGKEVTDNAVATTYMNRQSRWNWGLSAGWIPALVGASQSVVNGTDASGRSTLERDTALLQQIHREAAGIIAYPFNRAQRIEASVGVDSIAFDERSTSTVYSTLTGATLSDVTLHRAGAPTATLFQTSAALVYDTAVFGVASPAIGQRYRFSVAPSFGDIHVVTTIADYRRYFMPAHAWTIALRGESVARLGSGATDPRLLPLVWNMRDVVRGFDTDNDTIRTSRYLLGNIELRTPLATLLGRDGARSRLPVETLAFGDCGRFWMPNAASTVSAQTLCSAGVGARINAAGLVFEFDAVRPFGAASQGWGLSINFIPGF